MSRDRVGAFQAKFRGTCGGCGLVFPEGAGVYYDDDDVLLAVNCCGEPDAETFDSQLFPPERQAKDIIARVMPRGASVKQRCGRCFQIPASNGACACS